MDINNTSSGTTPAENAQLYYFPSIGGASDSTLVTTVSTAGGVGKSPRRRSRASRRAPTTLLNTDAANFRALVQQFTGFPSAQPYPQSNIHFGQQRQAARVPFSHSHQQQQQQQMQTQQYHVQQLQQQQMLGHVGGSNHGDAYELQEFSGNPREGFFMNVMAGSSERM